MSIEERAKKKRENARRIALNKSRKDRKEVSTPSLHMEKYEFTPAPTLLGVATFNPSTKKTRNTEEADIQKAFFKWLHLWKKEIVKYTFHIPNGGFRDIREAVNLKAMGVTPGIPDVFCAMPAFGYNGLFIEFKSKKGIVTSKQELMIDGLTKNGYKVVICHDWVDAKEIMEWYQRGSVECLKRVNLEQK